MIKQIGKKYVQNMYSRRSSTVKYFLAALLGAAIYAEWLIYLIQPMYWAQHDCLENDPTCAKILFIADPQIQGNNAVPPPLSYIINWDSDRYLRSTFTVVANHFKPDILVFLGDLMDEGSKATMDEFHGYVKRIQNIFYLDHDVKRVWLPGDNDIGGEHEPVYRDHLQEFERSFPQPSVLQFGNITFFKVNVITYTYPHKTDVKSKLKIVVSHYSILLRDEFNMKLEKRIHPDIHFCAHDHKSLYIKQNIDGSQRHALAFYEPKDVLNLTFNEGTQHEVFVPTCSYRMGTSNIGYGAAVVDNDYQNMRYAVFWSPKRFPYLFFYLVILIIYFIYCLVFWLARFGYMNSKVATPDMSPLLKKI